MMAKDKQPPIRDEKEISEQKLGLFRPPSKAEVQSQRLAADLTPKESQAAAARVQQRTDRAMEYVQAQKKETPTQPPPATSRPKETPELASDAHQRDNLRDASRATSRTPEQEKEKNHER